MPSLFARIALRNSLVASVSAWAAEIAQAYDARLDEVCIPAWDGFTLHASLITPQQWNRKVVIFVHGRKGNHQSMLGRAPWYLKNGNAEVINR